MFIHTYLLVVALISPLVGYYYMLCKLVKFQASNQNQVCGCFQSMKIIENFTNTDLFANEKKCRCNASHCVHMFVITVIVIVVLMNYKQIISCFFVEHVFLECIAHNVACILCVF